MDALHKKMKLLREEKEKIEDQLKALLNQRNEALLQTLTHLPAHHLDLYTLVGGLLDVIQQVQQRPQQQEDWRKAGQKFCRTLVSLKAPQKDDAKLPKNENNTAAIS